MSGARIAGAFLDRLPTTARQGHARHDLERGPADHAAGMRVRNESEADPAPAGPDAADGAGPFPVRHGCAEIAVRQAGCDADAVMAVRRHLVFPRPDDADAVPAHPPPDRASPGDAPGGRRPTRRCPRSKPGSDPSTVRGRPPPPGQQPAIRRAWHPEWMDARRRAAIPVDDRDPHAPPGSACSHAREGPLARAEPVRPSSPGPTAENGLAPSRDFPLLLGTAVRAPQTFVPARQTPIRAGGRCLARQRPHPGADR